MRKAILVLVTLVVTIVSGFKIVSNVEWEEAMHWTTYDNVGRYLALQPAAKSDAFDWLPNSNKIGFGYNPVRGDPVCYTGDCHMSGYGRSIFQLNYTKPPKGSCTTKLIPEHVELDCIPSTEVREKTQKISDVKEFKESTASGMSWSFGVTVHPTANPIAALVMKASFQYGQSEQTTKIMNHIYRDASVVYHTYARVSTVKLSLFAPKLELSDNFRYVIHNLPTGTYTPAIAKYIQDYVFNYFGFTYTTELLLGGIAQMITVINQTSIQPLEQEYHSASQMAGLTFAKVFSFNYNENENETSSKIQGFQKYVKSSTATTVERFPNDSQIQLKVDFIKQALEEYFNHTSTVYCENQCTDKKQGICQPLEAYGYGLCSCLSGYTGFDCSQKIPTPPPSTTPPPPPPPAPQKRSW